MAGSPARALLHRLRRAWDRWGPRVIWVGIVYVVVAAVLRMRFALPHSVRDVRAWSAIDFRYRFDELTRWFDGLPVYGAVHRLTYPPATYSLLWPFAGWLPLGPARVVWVITILLATAAIAVIAYRLTDASPRRERLLIASVVFASYPVQIAVFVGQLPIHAIALVAAGAFVLTRGRPGWPRDLGGAALLAASLVKPTLTPPVVVATLIAARRWRLTVLTGAIYAALAVVASIVRPEGIIALHRAWLSSNTAQALTGELEEALPNIHEWLSLVGLGNWGPAASLLVLVVFAAWAWRHREAEPWMLIGAAALVARLWSYHREYDDAVVLLAVIALLRAARGPDVRIRVPAAILFAATAAAMLTPSWALYDLAPMWIRLVHIAHMVLWITVLAFFLLRTGRRPPGLASPTGLPAQSMAVGPG